MGIKINSKDGNCSVIIDENMTIYEVIDQKKKLMKALMLKKNKQMEIDLSNVNEMDTAGLQILLLLKRTAENENKIVIFVSHSPATLDVIDRYNLAEYLDDPAVVFS